MKTTHQSSWAGSNRTGVNGSLRSALSNRLSLLCLIGSLSLAGLPGVLSAAPIYLDEFTGGSGDSLNSQAPGTRPGAEVWTSGSRIMADGSAAGTGYANAYLPFAPVAGNRYVLSADLNPTAGGNDWMALGFSADASTDIQWQSGPNNPVAWLLLRANRGAGTGQTFLGPQTASGVPYDAPADAVHVEVVLDTAPANWTVQWFINGVSVRGPHAFSANPTINYAGFGFYQNTGGMIDNFSLSTQPLTGPTIVNPSFEAIGFATSPGYISVNAPIPGWDGNPTSRVGQNPATDSPFANNGAIPNGANVAFIQSAGPSTLSTLMRGLTPNQKYTVNFRLNARTSQTPFLKVAVDGQRIVNLSVGAVGGTAAYRYAAFDFMATAEAHTLWLTNDAAGDTAVMVDNFSIQESTGGWSYAPWSDDASSGVDGTKNYTHAYNFGGGASPDPVINGVAFRGIAGGNPAVAREFRISGIGNQIGGDDSNALTAAGGGSAALASRFIYGGNPGSVTLFGLVPGMEYEASFYSVGWEAGIRAQTFYHGEDRLTVDQDGYGIDQGIRVAYRYVAPASGAITLSMAPMLPASSLHFYGFANREVDSPELPVVGIQPRSQVTTPGSTATFFITAGGARPLYFQWLKEEIPLTDQTNRFLTVQPVVGGDAGGYSVVVSNAFGAVTSTVASLTLGMIANPSFEADLFEVYPGYVSANYPISGWSASDNARTGINPLADGPGPFANNGAVPDGLQVGLLQSAGAQTLSTILGGLTPGETYTVSFRANSRQGQTPNVHLAVDGTGILDFQVGSVGTTNPYHRIAFDFIAPTASPVLTLTNDAGSDTTLLLDDFQIAVSTSRWSYAAWIDDASSGVDGTQNYTHAYNFGGFGLAVDTRIDGILFEGAPGANPAVNGRFSSANFTGAFGNDANALSGGTGGSRLLGQSFVYFGSNPIGPEQSITLSNLIPGVEYEATLYLVAFGAKTVGRAANFRVGEDRMTINEHHFDNDNGMRVQCRYVAGDDGTVTLAYQPTAVNTSIHTYGFSNREVNSTNAPSFYALPVSQTVAGGSSVVFEPLVGGVQPMFFQWYKDGVEIPGENNRVLNLPSVTGADTATYTLLASNVQGTVTTDVTLEVGVAMINASFEADTFTNSPGYISGNFPITGWTNSMSRAGINPLSNGQSPFANRGVIPDGTQVAFIQDDNGSLSQVVTGLTVGTTYYVKFYANSRGDYPAPGLSVSLGGETVLELETVPAGDYVRMATGPFLATSDSAELAFTKLAGPAGGDSTLVLDNVAVLELPPTPPTFLLQPESSFVLQGENLTLYGLVTGTLPMGLQWQRDGEDLVGAVANSLDFTGILLEQKGQYTLIASNALGVSTSEVSVVRVGLPIAELFNTGVDGTGALLEGGMADPHYSLVSSADPAYPGPEAVVLFDAWPIPPYLTNGPASKWLSPLTNSSTGNLDGNYIYETAFLLDVTDPTSAMITGQWSMDNIGVDILLNGTSLGISGSGFNVFNSFVITNGFVAGMNTLSFVISNTPPPGPTAMRVELQGLAEPLPAGEPQILVQPQSREAILLQNVELSVVATGGGPLSYMWYYEGFELFDETNRTLRLPAITSDQQGNYTVVVVNPSGFVESSTALVTVLVPPTITTEPISQTVARGETATFIVEGGGTEPLDYQWYFGDTALLDETNATLAIVGVTPNDAGDYRLVLSNRVGAVTSAVAVLTVPNSPPTALNDGLVVAPDQPAIIPVATLLANDSDPEGDALTITVVSETSTNGGSVSLTESDVTYTPLPGFTGSDRFSYIVRDEYGESATAEVEVFVNTGQIPEVNHVLLAPTANGYRARFSGEPGRSYQVQRADSPEGPWNTLDTIVAPAYGLIEYEDTNPPADQAFYRVFSLDQTQPSPER